MQLDQLERLALAAFSAGADIDLDQMRADHYEELIAEPEFTDPNVLDLQRALGVGRYGHAD